MNKLNQFNNPNSQDYNASSIQIKSEQSINTIYYQAPLLAKQYKKPQQYVHRLLEAGALYGKSISWIEDRYLDTDLPKDPEFSKFYAEFLKDLPQNSLRSHLSDPLI